MTKINNKSKIQIGDAVRGIYSGNIYDVQSYQESFAGHGIYFLKCRTTKKEKQIADFAMHTRFERV